MIISLDYDNTYSADPAFWGHLILSASLCGHKVIVVTFRDDRFDKTTDLIGLEMVIPVFYTRGVAKRWYMEQFAPDQFKKIDVWIDDKPESILQNSTFSANDLKAWRASA